MANFNPPTETKSGQPTPPQVESYLKGLDYPVDKNTLLQKAEENNAPDDVLNLLQQCSEQTYNSPIDVSKALGQLE